MRYFGTIHNLKTKLDLEAKQHLKVVCPACGLIYKRFVEAEHANKPEAYRKGGYLVIYCEDCKKEIDKRVKEISDESISSAH